MRDKVIHVVFGTSARGAVRWGLQQNSYMAEIVYPNLDFSYGYIPKDFSDKELCFALASHGRIDMFDHFKSFIYKDFSSYDKIIVWHGWSSGELFLLYLMSIIVDKNLYHIDIRDSEGFMKKLLSEYPSCFYPGMGFVSPDDVLRYNMVSLAKPISKEEQINYRQEWYRWLESNATYRFSDYHDGIIREYSEDFMDASILEYAKTEPRFKVLVCLVMSKYDSLPIWDTLIMKRIYELCWEGKLDINLSLR